MAVSVAGIRRRADGFIFGQAKALARLYSKSVGAADHKLGGHERIGRRATNGSAVDSSCWVPHPRSGIYVPQGQERVIDDVPDGAACFGGRTFWLRTVDAVDKPDPDTPADHFIR